ncbi:DUF302 domain-containing protein [Vibrio coralliilyticus]|uniref:Membrane protein n=1 Tax=Vibrio coralliilyticus TaxID=190893 RepID=A0AAN0SFG8_9VIBR|nr:DUF302 domain-containing protein [Vibrio coralliilyticus]AIW21477.1 membrane protein [Vibrio coralliilyticus]NOH42107.1 DUF302 domain-containing protein [Vibrio coralliilyticus]
MLKFASLGAILLSASMSVIAAQGVVMHESPYSVKETADRFEAIAKKKGLNIFARVDHQANAEGVGLELRPTELIIFGNPKVGTPLMQCAQSVAIDLPQKVLVTQDKEQKVWLSYNDPNYIKQRHDVKGCDEVITKVTNVLSGLSKATTSQ